MKAKLVGVFGVVVIAASVAFGFGATTPVRAEAAFVSPAGTFADACAFMDWYDAKTGRENVWSGSQWAGVVCD